MRLDDPTDKPYTARTADDGSVAIPDYGDGYPGDAAAKARNITARLETEDRLTYVVSVTYETPGAQGPGQEPETDPLADDPKITWGFDSEEEVAAKDKDGEAIKNSAKDSFDPPIVKRAYYPICTITRNEATFDPADADDFVNSVNNAGITIAGLTAAARKALMLDIACGEKSERNGTTFYPITFLIRFDRNTWDRDILDQGYNYIDAGEKKRITIQGQPCDTPQRLDGSGGIRAHAAADVFLTFRETDELDWSALNLPETM